jgi:phosphohistidine phosphatase
MRTETRIYEAPESRLLSVVQEVEPEIGTLLLIGHNPGLQNLLRLLLGAGHRHAYGRAIDKYPPAGLAVVDLPAATWRDVVPYSGRFHRFVTPQSLGVAQGE